MGKVLREQAQGCSDKSANAWISAGIEKAREYHDACETQSVDVRYQGSGELWCVVCLDCDEQMFLNTDDDGTAHAFCLVSDHCANEWHGPSKREAKTVA